MIEEDGVLKDKTTFHTPSEIISNVGGIKKNTSDNTITTTQPIQKVYENDNFSLQLLLKRKEKMKRERVSLLPKAGCWFHIALNNQILPNFQNKSDDDNNSLSGQLKHLKMTDETNSKNVSVSDKTVTDEGKRKSFISSRSRTNEFQRGKPNPSPA